MEWLIDIELSLINIKVYIDKKFTCVYLRLYFVIYFFKFRNKICKLFEKIISDELYGSSYYIIFSSYIWN